jgi:hypothetical protein
MNVGPISKLNAMLTMPNAGDMRYVTHLAPRTLRTMWVRAKIEHERFRPASAIRRWCPQISTRSGMIQELSALDCVTSSSKMLGHNAQETSAMLPRP